jgi:hypothetical protein
VGCHWHSGLGEGKFSLPTPFLNSTRALVMF